MRTAEPRLSLRVLTVGVSKTTLQTLLSRATGSDVVAPANTESHNLHLSLAGWDLRRLGS